LILAIHCEIVVGVDIGNAASAYTFAGLERILLTLIEAVLGAIRIIILTRCGASSAKTTDFVGACAIVVTVWNVIAIGVLIGLSTATYARLHLRKVRWALVETIECPVAITINVVDTTTTRRATTESHTQGIHSIMVPRE
jgi:hypothetical protein